MGDIFNASRPDSMSVDIFRSSLAAMRAHELPVYVIQGQHDRSTPPWPVAIEGEHLSYVNKAPFQPIENGPVFYGIDQHPVAVELQAVLKDVPSSVNVLVMHQLARDVFPLDGAWDFDTAWIPDHIKGLYIGDYHVPADFKWKGGTAYYSGSTYMCSISEPVNKSFLHVKVDGKGQLKTERIPLKTRRYHKLAVNDDGQLAEAVNFLKACHTDPNSSLHTPVVVLNYLVTVPKVMDTIKPLADGRYILWPVPTSNRIEWKRDGAANDTTIKHASMENCVGTFLASDSEAYKLVMDLLTNPDTEEILNQWRIKKGVGDLA